ncbi:hypothetical protein [Burkholderia sp. MSMB1826]|uniref:hypothetical protein n=1 Tax=Burkholderia sp. MSMB1826 TaxID=1637875 RepID=UPI000A877896|nr:hypothetical protein [Burkholderia sp. MSMB1826]
MDDIKHHDDFPPLTADQIRDLVESIQDAFGNDFSRAVFANHLLALLEDVPGYETGDVPALDRIGVGRIQRPSLRVLIAICAACSWLDVWL